MQFIRNIFRGLEIIFTFAKCDCLFFLEKTKIEFLSKFLVFITIPFRPKILKSASKGERLLYAFQNLGACFIKLGQALSVRGDIVGDKIAKDLTNLQDKLPFFPFEQVKEIIERNLDKKIHQTFKTFDEKPVAAASIAQVHFAKTFNDEDVAVKILRPNIKEKFIGDIELVIFIARFFARFSKVAKRIKFLEIMEIFRKNSLIEMDFLYEASAAAELAENFKNDENIRIPKVYWDYSAKEILTIERFFGSRIDDIETLKNKGIDVNDILKKSSLIFVNQVLRDGFFHADMHPGNVLVDDEGKICIFDFGIMGRLDKKTRVFLAELLIGFLNRDYKKVADLHFDYGFVPFDQDRDLFAQACRFINEPILNHPQNQISIAKLLENLLKMAEDFKMNTDPRLFLLQKTMVMAEGIGRMLNDKANFWNISEDIIKDWGKENLGLKSKIFDIFEDVKDILKKLKFLLDEAVSKKNMN